MCYLNRGDNLFSSLRCKRVAKHLCYLVVESVEKSNCVHSGKRSVTVLLIRAAGRKDRQSLPDASFVQLCQRSVSGVTGLYTICNDRMVLQLIARHFIFLSDRQAK